MELLKHFAFLAVLLMCNNTKAALDENENAKDVVILQKLLEDTVKADLVLFKGKLNGLVDSFNTAIGGVRTYIDASLLELKNHIDTLIKENDATILANIKKVEANRKEQLEESTRIMIENIEAVRNNSFEERTQLVDWAHQRFNLHEDILESKISICAYDVGFLNSEDKGLGTVTYSGGGYLKNSVSIQLFDHTEDSRDTPEELQKENLLNLDSGAFTVPTDADGEYLFTFSVIMDVFSRTSGLTPSEYVFRVNEVEVVGTRISSTGGSSWRHDKLTGSRTVLLKLVAGDVVDVVQTKETDVKDLRVLFCAALLHLDQVNIYIPWWEGFHAEKHGSINVW